MNPLRALFLLALLPTQSLALSVWIPNNFGDYIDNLNALGRPYKIVYGHYASIAPLTIEDTTSARPADFIANGYVSKIISAPAVFALVDPRSNGGRAGQLDVNLSIYWSSAPAPGNDTPDPQGYKHLNFIDLGDPAHGDRIISLSVNPDGTLSNYAGDYMFTGPFTPMQARELAGCVFDGKCSDGDIAHLRQVPFYRN
jgi:hypothetical protein